MSRLKFGVDLLTCESAGYDTYDVRGAEKIFSKLKHFGCQGVEPMGVPEKSDRVKPIAELLRSYDLPVIDVTGIWGRFAETIGTYPNKDPTSSDPSRKRDSIEYIKKCCDIAGMFGAGHVQVALGSLEPQDLSPKGVKTARRNLVEVLNKATKYCKDRGVRIMLEPQNRYEGYLGVNNTMSLVLEIIDEVDPDTLVPMLDTFHAHIEEASTPDVARETGRRLALVHSTDSNRLPPGFGSIDFRPILRSLIASGYGGFLSIESMPIGPGGDAKIERGLNYIRMLNSTIEA
jgi:D-psicose/D-tagatose/L-ribulose 3-epimerase